MYTWLGDASMIEDGDLAYAETLLATERVVEAMSILERLADRGSGEAAFRLAHIYRSGLYPARTIFGRLKEAVVGDIQPSDWPEHARWCKRAAELGYANAQCELALLYFHGTNRNLRNPAVAADDHVAFKWATTAVENPAFTPRTIEAMAVLAELYAFGRGCLRDVMHAALLQVFAALLRDQLQEHLPPGLPFPITSEFHPSEAGIKFAKSCWLHYLSRLMTGERLPLADPGAEWLQLYRALHDAS